MRKTSSLNKISLLNKKNSRAQVFIMATLLIVVYSVSIIAIVTELSVERYNEDEINLDQVLDDYIGEMEFQLKKSLFEFITNSSVTIDTVIQGIEKYFQNFNDYAALKGVQFSSEPKYDEFSLTGIKNNVVPSVLNLASDFSQDISIALNVTVTLQSTNSASTITAILTHYYGINAFISTSSTDILTFTTIDQERNILNYISGITFTSPLTPVDQGNGNYFFAASYDGEAIHANLPSGLEFLS